MLSRCDIVQWIDEETEKLQRARALLTGHTPPLKRGLPHTRQYVAAPSAATRKRQAERKQGLLAEYGEMDNAKGITTGVGLKSHVRLYRDKEQGHAEAAANSIHNDLEISTPDSHTLGEGNVTSHIFHGGHTLQDESLDKDNAKEILKELSLR
jgi:hypothetical protein